jgi:hypothetical protein
MRLSGLRKIINGRILFFGRTYVPTDIHHPYNGELDGQTWFFMGYEPLDETKLIAMWGSKKLFEASKNNDQDDILFTSFFNQEANHDPETGAIN